MPESACNAGDPALLPGLGRPPGSGNGNPLQYSRLENFKDRGACWATVRAGRRVRLSNSFTRGQPMTKETRIYNKDKQLL